MCKTKTPAHVEAHGRQWRWKLNPRPCEKKKVVESLSAWLPCKETSRRASALLPPAQEKNWKTDDEQSSSALLWPCRQRCRRLKQKGGDGGERRGGRMGPGWSNWDEQGGGGGRPGSDWEGGLVWVSSKWKLKTGFFNPFLCIGGCWIAWARCDPRWIHHSRNHVILTTFEREIRAQENMMHRLLNKSVSSKSLRNGTRQNWWRIRTRELVESARIVIDSFRGKDSAD